MYRTLSRSLLAAALLVPVTAVIPTVTATSVRAQDSVDVEVFYRELDRHGRWFSHPSHGYIWSPDVDPDWRPYTVGQWVFTDEHGWFWQSDEPFGWATFHYGRWFLDDDAGWVWVPGTEWAPAWVAWRHSDEQVGWAPLPPEAEWRGDTLSFSSRYYESPRYVAAWCFVPVALLTANRLYRHVAPASRNTFFVRQTNWVPSHRSVDRRIYNVGFDRGRYERITRRPLVTVRIVDSSRPQDYGQRGFGGGSVVNAYRPQIRTVAPSIAPPRVVEPPRRDGSGPARPGWVRPGNPTPGGPQSGGPGGPTPGGPGWWRGQNQQAPQPQLQPPSPAVVNPQTPPQGQRRVQPTPPPSTVQPTPQPQIINPQVIRPNQPPPNQPTVVRPPVQQTPPPVVRQAPTPQPGRAQGGPGGPGAQGGGGPGGQPQQGQGQGAQKKKQQDQQQQQQQQQQQR